LLGLGGCPVTDDYFIDAGPPLAGGSASGTGGAEASAGFQGTGGSDTLAQGGSAQAGKTGPGGHGGAPMPGPAGGDSGVGGGGTSGVAGAPDCAPATERCNGHDDNCNDLVDELACSSDLGCTGFTLSTTPNHGYMFCSSHKSWMAAREACAMQDMRLAALQSAAENSEVAKTLEALTNDTEVTIGANDQGMEGKWVWDGGMQFWQGNQTGKVFNGSFEAWGSTSPDDYQNEDCGVMSPAAATWADRNCAGTHAYLCEDKTP